MFPQPDGCQHWRARKCVRAGDRAVKKVMVIEGGYDSELYQADQVRSDHGLILRHQDTREPREQFGPHEIATVGTVAKRAVSTHVWPTLFSVPELSTKSHRTQASAETDAALLTLAKTSATRPLCCRSGRGPLTASVCPSVWCIAKISCGWTARACRRCWRRTAPTARPSRPPTTRAASPSSTGALGLGPLLPVILLRAVVNRLFTATSIPPRSPLLHCNPARGRLLLTKSCIPVDHARPQAQAQADALSTQCPCCRGFLYAIAHVRGGGDLGAYWHVDGMLMEKRNTFTDFITCAEHLIKVCRTSNPV